MKDLIILSIMLLLTGCSYIGTPSTDNNNENTTTGIITPSGIQYSGMISTEIKTSFSGKETKNELSKEIVAEINKPDIGLRIIFDPSLGEVEYTGSRRQHRSEKFPRKSWNIGYRVSRYRCNDRDTGGEYINTPYDIMIDGQKIFYSNSDGIPGSDDEGARMTTICFERNGKTHGISIISEPEYHKNLRTWLLNSISFDNSKLLPSYEVVGYAEFNKQDNSGYNCISQEDEDDCINKSKQKDNKYIMFHIVSSSDSQIFNFIEEKKGNLFVGEKSIGLGCVSERDNGKIIINDDDKILHEIAIKILNSTESNPISLKITQKDVSSKIHSIDGCHSFVFVEK